MSPEMTRLKFRTGALSLRVNLQYRRRRETHPHFSLRKKSLLLASERNQVMERAEIETSSGDRWGRMHIVTQIVFRKQFVVFTRC